MDDNTAAWRQAVAIARHNGGVITLAEIQRTGVSRRTVQRRARQGLLRRVGRGVFVLAGTPRGLSLATLVAQRQLPSGIATGPSALVLRGQPTALGVDLGLLPFFVLDHTTRLPVRALRHPGIRFGQINGYPVAEIPDAIVDILRVWPAEVTERTAYRAVQQGFLTAQDVVDAAARLRNHLGAPRLSKIARDLATGAHSRAERDFIRLLRAGRITGWQTNQSVWAGGRRYTLDIAFEEEKLFVEIDGRAYHSDVDRFQRDRTRQNALVLAGWTPMRFTWEDIKRRPRLVLSSLRRELERRRGAA